MRISQHQCARCGSSYRQPHGTAPKRTATAHGFAASATGVRLARTRSCRSAKGWTMARSRGARARWLLAGPSARAGRGDVRHSRCGSRLTAVAAQPRQANPTAVAQPAATREAGQSRPKPYASYTPYGRIVRHPARHREAQSARDGPSHRPLGRRSPRSTWRPSRVRGPRRRQRPATNPSCASCSATRPPPATCCTRAATCAYRCSSTAASTATSPPASTPGSGCCGKLAFRPRRRHARHPAQRRGAH